MQVSREYAIETLEQVRKNLSTWITDLKKPSVFNERGEEVPCYPESGVPRGLSVSNVEGIPVDQFRSELLLNAGILETLATTDIRSGG